MDYDRIKYLIEKESADVRANLGSKLTEKQLEALTDEELDELYERYHHMYRNAESTMSTVDFFNLKSIRNEKDFRFLK